MSDNFPAELKQFLVEHIESLAQLETLLFLHREPAREWSCEELARELYISTDMCQGIVADLERRKLLVAGSIENRYRYASADAEIKARVDQLAEHYKNRRVAVITEIYANPAKRRLSY